MPRSTSSTVTLTPAITAPLASRTRPTMAPASFCAHRGVTVIRIRIRTKPERVFRYERRLGMEWLLAITRMLTNRCRSAKILGAGTLRLRLYYELLLLLSFRSVCQLRYFGRG